MYHAFNNDVPDVPKSYCLHNFRVAAGLEEGEFGGLVFQDSDLYKYIEAVGFYLANHEDTRTEKNCDAIIDLIAKAQLDDGYVNTYFIINGLDGRWTNLAENHELYCAGHLMEAACAYYAGTGKRVLLEVACRFADCIDATFGPQPGKHKGYPGHQEIEIGLLKLYEITGEKRYRKLAAYFLRTRGQKPYYFDGERARASEESLRHSPQWSSFGEPYAYMQAHRPLPDQDTAVGHAVRACYMYTAAAHLAGIEKDEELLQSMVRLWENITQKRMYVTGGVGSMIYGEAFTLDYDLPNDMMYSETCASIALVMFSMRMLNNTGEARYADVIEQALYNSVLSGQQLDGTRFFYVNPMSVWRKRCLGRADMEAVKPERQGWFNCACCPPNILRTLTGLGQYIYSYSEDTVLVNLYVAGNGVFPLRGGEVRIAQSGSYPWDGDVTLTLGLDRPAEFALHLRIPGWCRNAQATLNGRDLDVAALCRDGFLVLRQLFHDGDTVCLHFPMTVDVVRSHPSLPFNAGKVALRRGPVVYCLEEADNGGELWNVALDTSCPIKAQAEPGLLDGVIALSAQGYRKQGKTGGELYTLDGPPAQEARTLRFIPYYAWCNRTPGDMEVWVTEYEHHK